MKLSVKLLAVGLLTLAVFGIGAQAAWATFSGGAAANYADNWWNGHNPNYGNYEGSGGDCCNFVSQCLHAGGLATTSAWQDPKAAWVNCGSFWAYFRDHARYDRVYIGTFDYFPGGHAAPERNLSGWGRGGVVGYDFECEERDDEDGYPFVNHVAINVLSPGSSQGDPDWPNMPWSGDLIDQHGTSTQHQYHRAWNKGDQYTSTYLSSHRWQYYVFYLPSTAY